MSIPQSESQEADAGQEGRCVRPRGVVRGGLLFAEDAKGFFFKDAAVVADDGEEFVLVLDRMKCEDDPAEDDRAQECDRLRHWDSDCLGVGGGALSQRVV